MSKVAFLKISECYAYDYVPFFLYLEHRRTEVPGNEATLVWCVCGHTVFAG